MQPVLSTPSLALSEYPLYLDSLDSPLDSLDSIWDSIWTIWNPYISGNTPPSLDMGLISDTI